MIIVNTLSFMGVGMAYGHLQWKEDERNSNIGPLPLNFYSLYLAFYGVIGFVIGFIMSLFV